MYVPLLTLAKVRKQCKYEYVIILRTPAHKNTVELNISNLDYVGCE